LRPSSASFAVAVAIYAIAWCVPVARASGELVGGTIWGWQAFIFALSPALGNDLDAGLALSAWMVLSGLSNLLWLVLLFVARRRLNRWRAHAAWWFGAAVPWNSGWMLLPDAPDELRLGYYLWLASFAVGAIAGAVLRSHNPAAGCTIDLPKT
jgi:hypothetical protein